MDGWTSQGTGSIFQGPNGNVYNSDGKAVNKGYPDLVLPPYTRRLYACFIDVVHDTYELAIETGLGRPLAITEAGIVGLLGITLLMPQIFSDLKRLAIKDAGRCLDNLLKDELKEIQLLEERDFGYIP